MNEAIKEALESLHENGLPFGAALYDENYNLIHSSHNKTKQLDNKDLHAEIVLFKELKDKKVNYNNLLLVTTCEPCEKCFKTAYNLGIRDFQFGSNISTSSKFFKSDKIIPIKTLAKDIYIEESNKTECDSLFELYKDKKKFLPNVIETKGNIIERYWMNIAFKVAEKGMLEAKEIPVGVLLVQEKGINDESLLIESHTMTYSSNTLVLHGDINALILSERKTIEEGFPITLYSTLEPHLLGFGAAMKARVRKVVFGLEAYADGGSFFFKNKTDSLEKVPYIIYGVYREKQYKLFKKFMEIEKNNQTRVGYPYVKNLVEYYEKVYKGEQ